MSNDVKYDRTLLHGLEEIAAYTGYAISTIRDWHRKHGLPLGKLPDGSYMLSTASFDLWLMARNPLNHPRRLS